jgi:hypothetical protein
MRGVLNDILRSLISLAIAFLGALFVLIEKVRLSTYYRDQKQLKRRYGITSDTPVLNFGPELEQLITNVAKRTRAETRFASTSGSTATPKRLLYTRRRLSTVKLVFSAMFARYCWSTRADRTSLYVFGSFSKDESLTSLLLEEKKVPSYLPTLQAPYRAQCHPAIQALVPTYGSTAVSLWILAIANPGVLYCTNPSALVVFLDDLATNWHKSSKLVRDWCQLPELFDPALHQIARRLESRGSKTRLNLIAGSLKPLELEVCAPAVGTYICWTGGYVKPFLNRLAAYLPAKKYRLIPMYSMSTEVIETVTYFDRGRLTFLPMAWGVFYEFVEEGREDQPCNLLGPDQLQAGRNYAMVVSDAYGLRRYQTGDVFICRGFSSGLPDLHFLRRRDLEYSFTGEKLTSIQVTTALEALRHEYPELNSRLVACVPSQPVDEAIPHYKAAIISTPEDPMTVKSDELSSRLDQLVAEQNSEYRHKRSSGRLGGIRVVQIGVDDFINLLTKSREFPAQFKFLPLYRVTWESLWTLRG